MTAVGPALETDVTVTRPDKYRSIRGVWFLCNGNCMATPPFSDDSAGQMKEIAGWKMKPIFGGTFTDPHPGQFQHKYYTIFFLSSTSIYDP